MEMRDVLQMCVDSGVTLSEGDGELRVHFKGSRPDAGLLTLLKRHKEALIHHLGNRSRGGPSASLPVLPAASRALSVASPAQRRMWLIDRMEKVFSPYNMVGAFRLHGAVDCGLLEASLDAVVARHEALRSNYVDVDGELMQVVREPFGVEWMRLDVSDRDPADREQVLQEILHRENTWRFDLELGPLVRATHLRCSPGLVVFVFNIHHIACDGWSVEILKREISCLYSAAVQGQSVELPPPRVQYADYSEWQRTSVDVVGLDEQRRYWKHKLAGLPQLHSLALDKPRPSLQTYTGRQIRRTVSSDLLLDIRAQCQTNDVTLFMFLQTALTAVLSIYSNERDIVMGSPVAGRRHRDADATVGLFVNTLVLRCTVDGNPTFNEMLGAHKKTILEALANQDVPYELLIDELRPGRSRSHSPLIQILFAMQNQEEGAFSLAGLDVEKVVNVNEPVKFDLQVVIEESAGRLLVNWHFNADLFEDESISRMAESFSMLLESAARCGEVRLYADATRQEDSERAARQDVSSHTLRRLEELFEEQASSSPERVAVSFEGVALSYRELDARANRLAMHLRALGVGRSSLVGLCLDRSLEIVIGILGVLKAGAAYVPLDMSYPMARLAAMVNDCDAAVLLTQRNFAGDVGAFGRRVVFLDDDFSVGPSTSIAPGNEAAKAVSDPAYVIYTSGTTGEPKGVVVSHAGVANLLAHCASVAPLSRPWNGSLWSSINFDVSVYEIFSPLCDGGTLHIVPDRLRLDPERLFQWMSDLEIRSTFLYAGYLEQFGEYLVLERGCRSLGRMLVGVEPISTDHLNSIAGQLPGLRILNGYGPTEATVCCTMLPFDASSHAANRRVPIGRAVCGMELHVMNAAGEPAPTGAVGELYVGGIGLALGYLNKPELTRERFVDKQIGAIATRLYRTGDVVRYLPSADLEFVGRVDEQIKVRGFRVEPGEIEVRLCEQLEIRDAVVVAVGDDAGKRIVAYIVPRQRHLLAEEATEFIDQTKHALRGSLPDYMVPSDIVLLETIPMTPNGKVDRSALPQPSGNRGSVPMTPPKNAIELKLVEIWKEVLGLEEVGTGEDFFALGGHSLHVIRLTSRIRKHYQVQDADLSLEDIFANPTIETLAEIVATALQREGARAKEMYLASLGESVEEGVF